MNYEYLLVESNCGIARITLNHPARRNALSLALMRELTDCLRELSAPAETRVIVLAANGAAFCAGHDLREMINRTVADYRTLFDTCVTLMQTIQTIPQPVIAEVHALATAAGCQLVATCDLVVASETASFATPGVKIGLFCSTPMVALTRAVGRKRALEMLLTGKPINAHTAAEWGLVNHVVAPGQLRATTDELAHHIANASAFTVSLGKQAFYAQIELDQAEAYRYTKEVMSLNALAADAQEGMNAFLEKRPACWTGR
jgi:enoyl-CoA hydratase/carnithine racemase